MDCSVIKVPIFIYEHCTFDKTYQWLSDGIAVDLSNYTALFTLRDNLKVSLLSCTEKSSWIADSDSGIYLDDASDGKYQLYLKDSDLTSLSSTHLDIIGSYDLLLITPSGETVLKQYGRVKIIATDIYV